MVVDDFSRKIVGASVHESECGDYASTLMRTACANDGVLAPPRVLHSDYGSVMKDATLLATLQELGIATSFSRPRVSDDNPFSEALFRTCKYRPDFPQGAFADLDQARTWVDAFVAWHNGEHRHSGVRFVTPAERHRGGDRQILEKRHTVYRQARARNPRHWSGNTRNWSRIDSVTMHRPRTSTSRFAA